MCGVYTGRERERERETDAGMQEGMYVCIYAYMYVCVYPYIHRNILPLHLTPLSFNPKPSKLQKMHS